MSYRKLRHDIEQLSNVEIRDKIESGFFYGQSLTIAKKVLEERKEESLESRQDKSDRRSRNAVIAAWVAAVAAAISAGVASLSVFT